MRVLICGSRDWADWQAIKDRVADLPVGSVVIHGVADGADKMAGAAAEDAGLWFVEVPCKSVHWRRYGRRAGHRRNAVMLDLAPDLVIAFQRNGSSGTQGTIDEAERRGIPVEVIRWGDLDLLDGLDEETREACISARMMVEEEADRG